MEGDDAGGGGKVSRRGCGLPAGRSPRKKQSPRGAVAHHQEEQQRRRRIGVQCVSLPDDAWCIIYMDLREHDKQYVRLLAVSKAVRAAIGCYWINTVRPRLFKPPTLSHPL